MHSVNPSISHFLSLFHEEQKKGGMDATAYLEREGGKQQK